MYWLLVLAAPLFLAVGALLLSTARALSRNYADATSIGVPVRVLPFSPFNPLWTLLDAKIVPIVRRLAGENNLTRYNWRGWDLEDRWRSHGEMGDAYVFVTPSYNMLMLNDPETIHNAFKRPVDFPRPGWINDVLAVFGPNIACAEGQSWKTQRRVATRCFNNELNNEIVWHESLYLADDILHYWTSRQSVKESAEDIRSFTLNVLARAGFGKSFKFRGTEEVADDENSSHSGESMSYRDSLATILENCILILAIGPKNLGFLSKHLKSVPKLQTVNNAVVSFQEHMTAMYEQGKNGGEVSDHNLMTLLIRASQEASATGEGLTEREIYGNLFTFNFAGHDTTAHTSTLSLYFLAANPDVQDWISEEIQVVIGNRKSHESEIDYRTVFPRLKRCLAVLYETLRLYTVVPAIKWTGDAPTTLPFQGKTLTLPPKTILLPNYCALHTDPRFWGDDSLKWRPSRWIKSAGDASGPGNEDMDTKQNGAFLGWSEGIRDCPGRKFSHVEFVALMVGLFQHWRVDPIVREEEGEEIEGARQRVLDLISRETGWVLLLQMLHPEKAPLKWRKV